MVSGGMVDELSSNPLKLAAGGGDMRIGEISFIVFASAFNSLASFFILASSGKGNSSGIGFLPLILLPIFITGGPGKRSIVSTSLKLILEGSTVFSCANAAEDATTKINASKWFFIFINLYTQIMKK